MSSEVTSDHLGLILQASREFALQLLGEKGGFLPFATRFKEDGEIDFVQMAWDAQSEDMNALYEKTQSEVAKEVRAGGLRAVATVANAQLDPDQVVDGFDKAIRVHVEASDFSRAVVIPYRFVASDTVKLREDVEVGDMVPMEIPPAIYAA